MEDDFFQVRLRDGEILQVRAGKHLREPVDIAAVKEADGIAVLLPVLRVRENLPGEGTAQGDPARVGPGQVFHGIAGDDFSLPDDGGPGAVALDLAEHMAGEEDGYALPVPFLQDFKERVLDQGIQAAGGLIQDQELRIVLQGADDADLFRLPKERSSIFFSVSSCSRPHSSAARAEQSFLRRPAESFSISRTRMPA